MKFDFIYKKKRTKLDFKFDLIALITYSKTAFSKSLN